MNFRLSSLSDRSGLWLPALLCAIVGSVALFGLSGCSSIPRDSYVRGVEIVTPWGTTKIESAATGSAARALSEAERREILATKPRTP